MHRALQAGEQSQAPAPEVGSSLEGWRPLSGTRRDPRP